MRGRGRGTFAEEELEQEDAGPAGRFVLDVLDPRSQGAAALVGDPVYGLVRTSTLLHLTALGKTPADESRQHLVDLASRGSPHVADASRSGSREVVAGGLAEAEQPEHRVLGGRQPLCAISLHENRLVENIATICQP